MGLPVARRGEEKWRRGVMADKDIKDIAHCVYMIDLVLREVMHSSFIANKEFATQCIIDSFVRILREEGYSVTPARLKKMLAYAH